MQADVILKEPPHGGRGRVTDPLRSPLCLTFIKKGKMEKVKKIHAMIKRYIFVHGAKVHHFSMYSTVYSHLHCTLYSYVHCTLYSYVHCILYGSEVKRSGNCTVYNLNVVRRENCTVRGSVKLYIHKLRNVQLNKSIVKLYKNINFNIFDTIYKTKWGRRGGAVT